MTTQAVQERDEIRSLAREFAATELRPHTEAWDRAGALPSSVLAQLGELGFFGMLVPESCGGLGFDEATFVTAIEELAWGEPAAALVVAGHTAVSAWLVADTGDSSDGELLAVLASGERHATIGWATDVEPLPAWADGRAAVSGTAAWLGAPRHAHLALVNAGAAGDVTAVLVELDAAQAAAATPHATMGLRPLALADVGLPATPVLAVQARDSAAVRSARIGLAAVAVGLAQAALDHARDYAAMREQFGTALREFEGIQHKLAEMRLRVWAARALLFEATRTEAAPFAAAAKVYAADVALWVTTQAVQVFGGYGYMRDYPVEKLMRDARAIGLLCGNDDVLRVLLARTLYDAD